ncbi:MAG TPA: hypothetical protein VG711_13200, partial [Phycisphaerales bacterium]|nr:hypothetical protein [Phycisphaerales bacterium]
MHTLHTSGILAASLGLFITLSAPASTIHVPADQPTIQAAITAAIENDTILVAPGTYHEALNFNGKPLTLLSESGSAVTIIDATGLNNRPVTIPPLIPFFKSIGPTDPATIFDGFTITGGKPLPDTSAQQFQGGGIKVVQNKLVLLNCVISSNILALTSGQQMSYHAYGGGIYALQSHLTLRHCTVSNNTAKGGTSGASGGGVYSVSGYLFAADSHFLSNSIPYGGGAGVGGGSGAGVYTDSSDIINCTFISNKVDGPQAGAAGLSCANSRVTNCLISGNILFSGTDFANPGAGVGAVSTVTFTNCTIAFNKFSGTVYPDSIGGVYGLPMITNCIVYGNDGIQIGSFSSSSASVNQSCVQNGFPGTGNISADPLFIDAPNGNFHLQDNSPCRDTGDRSLLPLD